MISVIGPGGVGGLLAGLLAHSGQQVTVVARRPDHVIVHGVQFVIVHLPSHAAQWEIADALRAAGVEVHAEYSEQEVLWRKLRFLAGMALLTSWADAPLDQALARDPEVARKLTEELAALATAEGLETSPQELFAALERTPAGSMSSLSLDVRVGGPTELDAVGNDLAKRAAARGIAVPTLERLIREIADRLR